MVSDGLAAVVFVEKRPGVYRHQVVDASYRTRDRVEILAGLGPGGRVVVCGALLLLNAV